MTEQRPISLNPRAEELEAVKITYPVQHSRRRGWIIEPMRFIVHDGMARK